MSRIVEIYDKYLQIYESYQRKKQQIETAQKEVYDKERQLEIAKSNVEKVEQQQQEAERDSTEAEIALNDYIKLYVKDSKRRSIEPAMEEFQKKLIYFKGDLTHGTLYEEKQEKVSFLYTQKKNQYYDKRKQELIQVEESIKNELENLHQNRDVYVQEKRENICNGCDQIIEAKKEEIIQYLSCNSKIKNSDNAERIKNVIINEPVDSEKCGNSEERLLKEVLELRGTSQYPRMETVTTKDVKMNKEMYKNIEKPFLIGFSIVLFLFFAFVFSPMSIIIPSSGAIAGVSHAVIQTIVRIVCSILFGVIVGVVLYGILKMFGMDKGAIIGGIILGLYGIIFVYRDHYPKISQSSFFGFGNVVHFIFVWILQIVLGVVIILLLDYLIKNTGLVRFFFRPKESTVLIGINQYEKYFNENKEKFVALFHIDEAMGYACKNRLIDTLSQNKYEMEQICDDAVYSALKKDCKKELEELQKERTSQFKKEERSRQENANQIAQKRRELTKAEDLRIDGLNRHLEELKADYTREKSKNSDLKKKLFDARIEVKKYEEFLEKAIIKEKEITEGAKQEKEFLEEVTNNICLNHEELQNSFRKLNNAKALLECQGNLEENMYFVRNKRDECNMAIIRKVPLNCKPTVYIYGKECIKGNSLSEELSHFIQWLCDSIRRVTPSEILSRFSVVDMVSGQSILNISPYNEYIDVYSDEPSKNKLAEFLKERETQITVQCNRQDAGKYQMVVNSINSLNQIKMKINEEDIAKQEDLSVVDFWEQLIPYRVIIFIISPIAMNSVQPSVLNDALKQSIKNSERFGILPLFLVDEENWENDKANSDVSFLHGIQDKNFWNVLNVGRDTEMELDIV